jgi:chromosome segregation ATPase
LAAAENALEGPGLAAFAAALNERARLILDERVRGLERESSWRRETIAGLEERVLALEKESSWRRDTIAGLEEQVLALEKESSWRRDTIAGLEEQVLALEQEISWQRETTARLEEQSARLRTEGQIASQAHDKLLAHHRQVLGMVTTELDAIGSLPFTRLRQVRRRLKALAESLRAELS